jgi:hypothetical protein
MSFLDAISRNDAAGQARRLSHACCSAASTAWFRISGVGVYARPHHEPLVARVSKPVYPENFRGWSPTSKSAGTRRCTSSGFGNPRSSRLGSRRYVPAPVQGAVPGSAGVSPANSGFRLPTGRRDAGAPRRFMVKADVIPDFRVHPKRPVSHHITH